MSWEIAEQSWLECPQRELKQELLFKVTNFNQGVSEDGTKIRGGRSMISFSYGKPCNMPTPRRILAPSLKPFRRAPRNAGNGMAHGTG
jgi:hypothetical protein